MQFCHLPRRALRRLQLLQVAPLHHRQAVVMLHTLRCQYRRILASRSGSVLKVSCTRLLPDC